MLQRSGGGSNARRRISGKNERAKSLRNPEVEELKTRRHAAPS